MQACTLAKYASSMKRKSHFYRNFSAASELHVTNFCRLGATTYTSSHATATKGALLCYVGAFHIERVGGPTCRWLAGVELHTASSPKTIVCCNLLGLPVSSTMPAQSNSSQVGPDNSCLFMIPSANCASCNNSQTGRQVHSAKKQHLLKARCSAS